MDTNAVTDAYAEIEGQIEEELKQRRMRRNRPQRINVSMLRRRCLPYGSEALTEDEVVDGLFNTTHIRLDRENIHHIEGLDMLGPVTNLYLQSNEIERIENLSLLPSLRFLALQNNRIKKIENLSMLKQLRVLDLRDNLIDTIDGDELPTSLWFLNLQGNPCAASDECRRVVIACLPLLKELDGVPVSRKEKEAAREELKLPPMKNDESGEADVLTIDYEDEHEDEAVDDDETDAEEESYLRAFVDHTDRPKTEKRGQILEEEWESIRATFEQLSTSSSGDIDETQMNDGNSPSRQRYQPPLDLASLFESVERQAAAASSARKEHIDSMLARIRSEHAKYTARFHE